MREAGGGRRMAVEDGTGAPANSSVARRLKMARTPANSSRQWRNSKYSETRQEKEGFYFKKFTNIL